jgi:membrane protease subunit (stomatin/prohibitin family)
MVGNESRTFGNFAGSSILLVDRGCDISIDGGDLIDDIRYFGDGVYSFVTDFLDVIDFLGYFKSGFSSLFSEFFNFVSDDSETFTGFSCGSGLMVALSASILVWSAISPIT